jgi:predicted adenylyl cyclase CyaB
MSDILKAIHDDMESYLALCGRYGENPVYDRSGLDLDCYGEHAKKLEKRDLEERGIWTLEKVVQKKNLEVEVKIPVSLKVFDGVVKKLWENSEPEFCEEKNIFYKVPSGFLRLRKFGEDVKVTYKGKREKSEEFNSREEIEFDYGIDDFEKLQLLFSRMGMKRDIEYTKRRANYLFGDGWDGHATISLDVLEDGKRFIEVEDKPEVITNVLKYLELNKFPRERRSYLQIVKDGKKNKHYNR